MKTTEYERDNSGALINKNVRALEQRRKQKSLAKENKQLSERVNDLEYEVRKIKEILQMGGS